ncbi:hypothetical protein FNV43_RR05938 [Rhamnella rubrinervis]|uniref:Uncharacterized protein n=1 Tax=Rhamnella rubrinervis TaxID=2594499 RepID=A0A8K0HCY1_9ROSA|nr:hypothetical protein FNV43_RR05938 [Rhamnella rubrinervis]
MASFSLLSASPHTCSLCSSKVSALSQVKLFNLTPQTLQHNPLRFSIGNDSGTMVVRMKKNRKGLSAVCYAAPLTVRNLQWVSTISSAVLMLAKGTGVQKSFIVPLIALQAPASVISWIKGEYGIWAAFLALLVRLFFFIPGELELPFIALLLVIVVPYQVLNLRGTQEGSIISLVIAGYLAFQHFSRAGSLQKAFDQGSIVATLAVISLIAASCLLLM